MAINDFHVVNSECKQGNSLSGRIGFHHRYGNRDGDVVRLVGCGQLMDVIPYGNRAVRRIFDLVLALTGLVVLGPLFVYITIWIKLDTPGPVFFRQLRVGQYGRGFRILKFRTMIHDAEKSGRYFTVDDDPRITRPGKFLRKYKLDELPQLVNVVLGEMSLVGPRPQIPAHMAEYPKGLMNLVLSVPPGLTGFASLAYINESEILKTVENPERYYKEELIPDKLRYYIKDVYERNLWLDFKLIFLTVLTLVKILFYHPPVLR